MPIKYKLISKTERYFDEKTGKERRKSKETKNEIFKRMIGQSITNGVSFKYVKSDVWFASADTMMFIKKEKKKDFVMPLKSNREIALSEYDKKQGRYVKLGSLQLEPNSSKEVYIEGVDFKLLLIKQIFKNKDDSIGELYLITSDLTLIYDQITTIYKKRWNVEVYHKSLKQNASLSKSPTQTVTTQSNHFFASICAFIKLERLKFSTKLNHTALKMKLYIKAIQEAFNQLSILDKMNFQTM